MTHILYVYRTNLNKPCNTQRQPQTCSCRGPHVTTHSQCSCCDSSIFLVSPFPQFNKHLVAVCYSQLLCASGLCRSERCQFTDQRPAIDCGNSARFAVPYSCDWTRTKCPSVRPALCGLRCTVHKPCYKQLFSFLTLRGLPLIQGVPGGMCQTAGGGSLC
jgi:hypothetical protein